MGRASVRSQIARSFILCCIDRDDVRRQIATFFKSGCDGAPLVALANRLTAEGAVPRFVSTTLGSVEPISGESIEVDVSLEAAPSVLEAAPSVLYDAIVLPDGSDAVRQLRADGRALEFIKDQYRHCKPMLAWGDSAQLLDACGIPTGESDSGLIVVAVDSPDAADQFVAAVAKHRHFARETDPPRV